MPNSHYTSTHLTPVVIIAGGNAERLNNITKCLITVGQTTLLERLTNCILAQQHQTYGKTSKIYLNINHANKKIIHLCKQLGIKIIQDTPDFESQGPLAGVVSALRVINSATNHAEHTGIITISGDSVFLPQQFYSHVHEHKTSKNSLLYSTSDQSQAFLHAYWPAESAEAIAHFLRSNQRSVGRFLKSQHAEACYFDQQRLPNNQTLDPFFNINTPKDQEIATTALLLNDA